jgi:hypothetical protein
MAALPYDRLFSLFRKYVSRLSIRNWNVVLSVHARFFHYAPKHDDSPGTCMRDEAQ